MKRKKSRKKYEIWFDYLVVRRQTDGENVLLEVYVLCQPDHGDIVAEVLRVVLRVDVLGLQLVVLVRVGLRVRPDVPLAQSNAHARERCGGHAVPGRDDPALRDEGAAAGDALGQEGLLDQGDLPRVAAELGVLSSNDAIGAGVNLAAFLMGKRNIFFKEW